MKRIKFTELGFKKDFDTLIVIIGIICLIIGMIAGLGFINKKLMSLAGLSAVIILFPHFKNFFYKNYFIWNKKGGNIKINSKTGNIVFSEIENVDLNESQLIFIKKSKNKLVFNLSDINSEDINKLKVILAKHIKTS